MANLNKWQQKIIDKCKEKNTYYISTRHVQQFFTPPHILTEKNARDLFKDKTIKEIKLQTPNGDFEIIKIKKQ